MKFYKYILVLAIAVVSIYSCKKERDLEDPVVVITAPANGTIARTGETLHAEVLFTDNQKLAQYRLKVIRNFTGPYAKTDTVEAWIHAEIGDITGKEQTVSIDIDVPAEAAAGSYYFIVSCVDDYGNESKIEHVDTVSFSLVNTLDTVPPSILLNSPANQQQFAKGDTILLSYLVSDNLKVLQAKAEVKLVGASSNVFENTAAINNASGLFNVAAPTAAWSTGSYNIYYTAIDSVNNQTQEVLEIIVN